MKRNMSFEKQMGNIINKIEDEVNGVVSFGELFDLGFMDKNSDFSTFGELLEHYGISVSNQEDFEALDEYTLDKAIEKSTCFTSWQEMYEAAGREYALRRLKDAGFDVE